MPAGTCTCTARQRNTSFSRLALKLPAPCPHPRLQAWRSVRPWTLPPLPSSSCWAAPFCTACSERGRYKSGWIPYWRSARACRRPRLGASLHACRHALALRPFCSSSFKVPPSHLSSLIAPVSLPAFLPSFLCEATARAVTCPAARAARCPTPPHPTHPPQNSPQSRQARGSPRFPTCLHLIDEAFAGGQPVPTHHANTPHPHLRPSTRSDCHALGSRSVAQSHST